MRFRRRAASTTGAGSHEADGSDPQAADTAGSGPTAMDSVDAALASDTGKARPGPWDAEESHGIDLERTIDLGAFRIAPLEDLDVRLQVDEKTSQIASVLLADDEGAVELRAFAAPRSGGLWEEIRPGVAEEVERLGGRSDEAEGPHGPELRVVIPLEAPDGQQVVQPSRVFGIEGPRWLVRATMLGRPAVEIDADERWWDALSNVVVVRGDSAMAPGDALPLTMPPGAFQGADDDDEELGESPGAGDGS